MEDYVTLITAVIRNRPEVVQLLLDLGGDPTSEDSYGRTPVEWAQLKGFTAVAEMLGAEKSDSIPAAQPSPTRHIWETGIKIIDLSAPLKWGGRNGIFTPLSGIGIDVMVGELIQRMATYQQGKTVQLLLEGQSPIQRHVSSM